MFSFFHMKYCLLAVGYNFGLFMQHVQSCYIVGNGQMKHETITKTV